MDLQEAVADLTLQTAKWNQPSNMGGSDGTTDCGNRFAVPENLYMEDLSFLSGIDSEKFRFSIFRNFAIFDRPLWSLGK